MSILSSDPFVVLASRGNRLFKSRPTGREVRDGETPSIRAGLAVAREMRALPNGIRVGAFGIRMSDIVR